MLVLAWAIRGVLILLCAIGFSLPIALAIWWIAGGDKEDDPIKAYAQSVKWTVIGFAGIATFVGLIFGIVQLWTWTGTQI